jgi:hypothetical protein
VHTVGGIDQGGTRIGWQVPIGTSVRMMHAHLLAPVYMIDMVGASTGHADVTVYTLSPTSLMSDDPPAHRLQAGGVGKHGRFR